MRGSQISMSTRPTGDPFVDHVTRGIPMMRIGAAPDAAFVALATLRTFRGKLGHAIEIDPQATAQLTLAIDSNPPTGGEIGGDDLALTPASLNLIDRSLAMGAELPVMLEFVPPAEWRSETEIARSAEHVGQIVTRVERAIARLLEKIYAAERPRAVASWGRAGAHVGASILQTPGAIVDEIRSIGLQVHRFDAELVGYLRAHGYVAPAIALQREQLATLHKIDSGDYDGANVSYAGGVVWKAGQLAALRAGGFTEAQAQALLGNDVARRAEIKRLEAQTGALAGLALIQAPQSIRELALFYQAAWSPFVDAWDYWERAHATWGDNFWTNHAPEAELLLAQLVELRQTASNLGMRVMSPTPYNPDVGLYRGSGAGHIGDKLGDKADEAWKLVKYAAYGALGIAGFAVIYSTTQNRSVRGIFK